MIVFTQLKPSGPRKVLSRYRLSYSRGLVRITGRCHFLSGDDDCSVHPGMVGAHVLVSTSDSEGLRESVGSVIFIHVTRVKATCPRGPTGGGHGVRNRVAVGPGHLASLRNRYARGVKVEPLRAANTLWDRNADCTASSVWA